MEIGTTQLRHFQGRIQDFFKECQWLTSPGGSEGMPSLISNATLLRCKLKCVVARITTHLKHCHATKFRRCKLKQHVASSWTSVYFFQHIFSTCNNKFCCVTMFEMGGNTFNNAFQLATTNFVAWQCLRWVVIRSTTLFNLQCNNVALQVAAICCSYYFTLKYAKIVCFFNIKKK